MPPHDDTDPTPTTRTIDSIRRELERYGAGPIRQGDSLDSLTRAVGRSMDHIHAIPPVMQGREAREAANAMRDLAPRMEVLLPRAPEPGSLSLMGAYTGQGRSMFGGVPIRTSPHVPEGSAFLVDRSALQFDPRASLQIDRAGSTYGVERAPGEGDDTYRERITHTLSLPLAPEDFLTEPGPQWGDPNHTTRRLAAPEPRMNPEEQVDSWRERAHRWWRRGNRETAPDLTQGEERAIVEERRCHRCHLSEAEVDSGFSEAGFCPSCTYARWQQEVEAKKSSGPTVEELEATYRV